MDLKHLSNMIERALEKRSEIADLENQLQVLQNDLRQLEEYDIPDMFMELGMSEMKLSDGRKVSVKRHYFPKIKDQDNFHEWLRQQNAEHLIRNDVSVQFGVGEDSSAKTLVDELSERGLNPSFSSKINGNTLKAFVREQIESGVDLPESISIHIVDKTQIK